jgi:hypothetical protein
MFKHTANEILSQTLKLIDGAYAPATIRAYKANFERFIHFCEGHQLDALPASPSAVAQYIS